MTHLVYRLDLVLLLSFIKLNGAAIPQYGPQTRVALFSEQSSVLLLIKTI